MFGKKRVVTGMLRYVMMVARAFLKAPFANVEVSTPYFSGTVEALCLQDPLYELIIGNISGGEHLTIHMRLKCLNAAVTLAQTRVSTEVKPLKIADVTNQLAVARKKLIQFQEENLSLSKCIKKEGPLVRNKKKHQLRKTERDFVLS